MTKREIVADTASLLKSEALKAPHINIVDEHIKGLLYTYPSLFKSRLSCLLSIFTVNGNGYSWVDGKLVLTGVELRTSMKYTHEETSTSRFRVSEDSELALVEQVRLRKEDMLRKFIADNIDVFVKHNVDQHEFSTIDMRLYNPDWCVLKDAPYATMHPDWAKAAKETMEIVAVQLRKDSKIPNASLEGTYCKTLRFIKELNTIIEQCS